MNNRNEREVVAKLRELGFHIHDDYCNFDRDDDVIANDWVIIDKEEK